MKLITSRLTLRPFEPDDWKDLYEYLSDQEVVKYEPYEPFSEEKCRQEARARAKNPDYVAVCLTDTGKVIGNLYLSEHSQRNYSLGYVFNRAYWRHAYATEAATALLTHAFNTLKANRVFAEVNPENRASERLLKRLTMRREGRLRQNESFHNDLATGEPIWQDTLIYAILGDEWSHRRW